MDRLAGIEKEQSALSFIFRRKAGAEKRFASEGSRAAERLHFRERRAQPHPGGAWKRKEIGKRFDHEPEPVRAERGKAFADLALALLDAYERAATPKRAVSAFKQAGILYDIPDFHHPERKLTYVDPAHARAVNEYLGLFRGTHPRPRGQRGPIPIPDLNSNVQTPSDRPRAREGRTSATGGA